MSARREPVQLGFTATKSVARASGAMSLVNMYAEPVQYEGRTGLQLLPAPGKQLFSTIGSAAVRGQLTAADRHFAVVGEALYSINAAGTATSVGTVEGIETVDMDYNGAQVSVVSDLKSYSYDPDTLAFAEISDPDFSQASSCCSLNGYSIFSRHGSDVFAWSSLRDNTAYDALDYATAESNPDGLVAVRSFNKNLWLLGSKNIEIWYNSGNPTQVFEPHSMAPIEIGCVARDSATIVDGSMFFVGRDGRAGGFGVYQTQGYQAKKVSVPSIDEWLEDYSSLVSTARGFAFQMLAHAFYVLTIPNTVTLVFDLSTQLWVPYFRSGTFAMGAEPGGVWDAVTFATNGDKRIVGASDGNLYELVPDLYTDAGNAIVREATCAQISKGRYGFTVHRVELDLEAGVGLTTGQGSDPLVMMSYSKDGHRTWSSPVEASMGVIGDYTKQAFWTACGYGRNFTAKFRVTDPVKTVFMGAVADVERHLS